MPRHPCSLSVNDEDGLESPHRRRSGTASRIARFNRLHDARAPMGRPRDSESQSSARPLGLVRCRLDRGRAVIDTAHRSIWLQDQRAASRGGDSRSKLPRIRGCGIGMLAGLDEAAASSETDPSLRPIAAAIAHADRTRSPNVRGFAVLACRSRRVPAVWHATGVATPYSPQPRVAGTRWRPPVPSRSAPKASTPRQLAYIRVISQ
jgi:hypothetical protein